MSSCWADGDPRNHPFTRTGAHTRALKPSQPAPPRACNPANWKAPRTELSRRHAGATSPPEEACHPPPPPRPAAVTGGPSGARTWRGGDVQARGAAGPLRGRGAGRGGTRPGGPGRRGGPGPAGPAPATGPAPAPPRPEPPPATAGPRAGRPGRRAEEEARRPRPGTCPDALVGNAKRRVPIFQVCGAGTQSRAAAVLRRPGISSRSLPAAARPPGPRSQPPTQPRRAPSTPPASPAGRALMS